MEATQNFLKQEVRIDGGRVNHIALAEWPHGRCRLTMYLKSLLVLARSRSRTHGVRCGMR